MPAPWGPENNNLVEVLKETLTPAGGHQIAQTIGPLGTTSDDNFSIRPPPSKIDHCTFNFVVNLKTALKK